MKIVRICTLLLSLSTMSAFAATQHDNYLCLSDQGQNDALNFTMAAPTDYDITASQGSTWGGVSTVTSGNNTGCLDVSAGRSDSSSVVQWIQMQGVINQFWNITDIAGPINDDPPTQLNFAFYGTLQVTDHGETYTCPDVGIAQGGDGSHNYWFIFNNAQADEDGPGSSLACSKNTYLVYSKMVSDDDIEISFENKQ